jgi:large subunit ribosomal protein L2
MGKPLLTQRRGKGSPSFKSPSHRFLSNAKYRPPSKIARRAVVTDIVHDSGHSAPLLKLQFEDGHRSYMIAPEGAIKDQELVLGNTGDISPGNVRTLGSIPESVPIYNIESMPGDGGKFIRSSGSYSYVVQKTGRKISVRFPSGTIRDFNSECRATIGVVAGGGRTEKPLVKAGKKHYKRKATNRRYPLVRGVAQNAMEHPFGGKQHHPGKSMSISRDAPPGKKVGHISSKRTGRRKR